MAIARAVADVGTCGTIHAHVSRATTYSHGCEEDLAISLINFPLSRCSRRIRPIVSPISIPHSPLHAKAGSRQIGMRGSIDRANFARRNTFVPSIEDVLPR